MTKKLFVEAILKFSLGVILVGLLVFVPAGTTVFWNGWLFMGVLFIPMFLAGIVMMLKNPELLKSRLNAKEKQKEQDMVIKLSGLIFLLYPFIIAKRIKHEELFLEKELNGYREYKEKVKYRLIPFVW